MQVQNGTGPGVRRCKRPLLASRNLCNVLWEPPKFEVKIGNKVKLGNKVANWCNIWSIEGVIVYGHVPECHIAFVNESHFFFENIGWLSLLPLNTLSRSAIVCVIKFMACFEFVAAGQGHILLMQYSQRCLFKLLQLATYSVCLHIYDWNIVNCDVKQPIHLSFWNFFFV